MKEKMNVKVMALLLAATLMVGGVIGGTIAWLIDKTDSVVNEFTYGDIDIELTESTGDTYHITPGNDISKDPTVTVKAGSEKCWLFVKISKENWPTFTEEDGTTKKLVMSLLLDGHFLKQKMEMIFIGVKLLQLILIVHLQYSRMIRLRSVAI